jgi:hypothetical protein
MLIGTALYPPLAARAKILDRFSQEAQPHTLDGMAYMDKAQYFDNNRDMKLAQDKAAIRWMLEYVEGSPVILEGNTPGYRWGNRFAIYTGLPAVMGWDWHQRVRRPGDWGERRHQLESEDYRLLWFSGSQVLAKPDACVDQLIALAGGRRPDGRDPNQKPPISLGIRRPPQPRSR